MASLPTVDVSFDEISHNPDIIKILEFRKLKREIRPLMMIVQQGPRSDFEDRIFKDNSVEDDALVVFDLLILKLQQLLKDLKIKAESQESLESDLFKEVMQNRSRLESDDDRRFACTKAGLGIVDTLQNLVCEQNLAMKSKKEWITKSILGIREDLLEIWKECMVLSADGAHFPEFYSEQFSQELLERHEKELEQWKVHHVTFQTLIKQIERRNKCWKRVMELQAKSEDPNRFINRGATLLTIQREMSSATHTLLGVEKKLIAVSNSFQEQNGRRILISGKQITDLIEQDWSSFEESIRKRRLRPALFKSRSGQTGWSAAAHNNLSAAKSLPNIAGKIPSSASSPCVTPTSSIKLPKSKSKRDITQATRYT